MVKPFELINNYIKDHPTVLKRDLEYVICEYFSIKKLDLISKDISIKESKWITNLFNKVRKNIPPQYIFNRAFFYNRPFLVNTKVLIPRFDSEPMMDEIIKKDIQGKNVLEVGTGSGALIITLAINCPQNNYTGVDISKSALLVSKKNSKFYQTNINFYYSNLFSNVSDTFDLIIANLPYLAKTEIKGNLKKEPRLALDGLNKDGLKIIFRFLNKLQLYLNYDGQCYLECNPSQITKIKNYIKQENLNLEICSVQKDFNHLDRYIILRRKTTNAT